MRTQQTQVSPAPKRPAGTVVEVPSFFNAKPGDRTQGLVTGTTTVQGKSRTSERYVLETLAGKPLILGSDADLNAKIKRIVDKHGFGTRELYIELTHETADIGKPSPMKIWLVIDVTGGAAVAKLPAKAPPPRADGEIATAAARTTQEQTPLLPAGDATGGDRDEWVPF